MNFEKPASEPQVNTPALPPVEMMYFLFAPTHCDTFCATSAAGVTPPQVSEPHSPDANAQLTDAWRAGSTFRIGERVPVTEPSEIWSTFQSMLIVTSLYEPKTKPAGAGAGGGDGGVGAGGGDGGVGAGGGLAPQLVVTVQGSPEPVGPLLAAGSLPCVHQLALYGERRSR